MAISSIEYRGCKHNATGLWHFCKVYGIGTEKEMIHPIGRCRESNRESSGLESCHHKTEQEAYDCYEQWEKEQIETGTIISDDDVLFPKNKALLATILAKNEAQK